MVKYDVENTPIVDLVNNIILVAVKSRASDIHFDPLEDGLKIRMRIDGNLQDHTILPKESERNIITRIKLISGMNITENRLPQDGAIKGRIDNLDLDMRVSALPTNEGEKVVIRILDYSMSLEGLSKLDFSPINYQKVLRMTQIPNGIILVTGATGSGKSTTTYAMLQTLNNEQTNIITVEDPIEMNIEGINQVQVNSEIGLDFARVLRSILRQDPNIILIGEIRDSETAKIAVRASITGHLVFSTIHTNNSLSTIERLLDMDVERYLLSSALTGIISQRLARKLCPNCKKLRETTPYEKKVFKQILNQDVNQVYDVDPMKECGECNHGYLGRIAIQEVLVISDNIRDALNHEEIDKEDLRKLVYTKDVTTLLQDGLEKVLEGKTNFDEIYRIIEIEDDLEQYQRDLLEGKKEYEKLKRQQELENQILTAPQVGNQQVAIKDVTVVSTPIATPTATVTPNPTSVIQEEKKEETPVLDTSVVPQKEEKAKEMSHPNTTDNDKAKEKEATLAKKDDAKPVSKVETIEEETI